jgi:hypothetical protein
MMTGPIYQHFSMIEWSEKKVLKREVGFISPDIKISFEIPFGGTDHIGNHFCGAPNVAILPLKCRLLHS